MADAGCCRRLCPGRPSASGVASGLFEFHQFVHDELPVACGDLRVARGQIGAGNLQVYGRLLLGFLARVEQSNCSGAFVGAEAFLFAGRVIVNVVATAVFSFIESVSLSHNCVYSDEVTTVDLDSGREQVGVTQGRPGLNPAGTSAGTRLWKLTKPYSSNWLGLEAEVGIGRFTVY